MVIECKHENENNMIYLQKSVRTRKMTLKPVLT